MLCFLTKKSSVVHRFHIKEAEQTLKDALPFFPNLSSGDLQKVSEEEGVRSGGMGSRPKAAGTQWEGDGEGAAAVSLWSIIRANDCSSTAVAITLELGYE